MNRRAGPVPIEVSVDGERHVGSYIVHEGEVTVKLGEHDSITSAIGATPPKFIARMLLTALARKQRDRARRVQ